ncbi:PEGA domain-containing protein [Candidatus Saccharibacteria bacterium]|nr:PEGA domain-containing protein [Candidatus Saccharibacteria bacterium]
MQRQSSKRRQIVMRSLVYGLMTLSVLTIVSVLMLIILGYSFNRQDGRLEQGGLLQFASTPSGATVTLDGMPTSSRTPSKASVEAKNHHVQMDLRGYRSWQKNITVQAGGIGWLSYARFVPTDVKVETMRTFPKLAASLASVDRKWIVIQEDVAVNAFVLANIESDTPKYANLSIPESILTQASTQSFTISAWSRNDDRLLVKRTYDGTKVEWISVNRQNPNESVNLTSSFGVAAVDMQFGERNGSDVFVLTDEGIVRRLDVGNKTLSEPLAENVAEYSIYDRTHLSMSQSLMPKR